MAEECTAKQGQVSNMTPSEPAETFPVPVPPVPTLEADLQAHIGRQLRAVYDEVVSESVPERFLKLLEELEKKETER